MLCRPLFKAARSLSVMLPGILMVKPFSKEVHKIRYLGDFFRRRHPDFCENEPFLLAG
jgi:hypothetical protein